MAFFDFNAATLTSQKTNPQLKHMGVIEFHIDRLVPGGKEALLLGVQEFNMPEARSINSVEINYLNGSIKAPAGPSNLGDLTVVFVDYIDGNQRRVLHQWFDLVFDESTGLGGLKSDIATSAHAVLFGQNGVESVQYYMFGVWPKNDPTIPDINYSTRSGYVTMSIKFAIDYLIDEVVGGINFGVSLGSSRAALNQAARVGVSASSLNNSFGGSVNALLNV